MGNEVQLIGNKIYPKYKQILELDVSNLTTGIYFLRIVNRKGQKTKKIIKNGG